MFQSLRSCNTLSRIIPETERDARMINKQIAEQKGKKETFINQCYVDSNRIESKRHTQAF